MSPNITIFMKNKTNLNSVKKLKYGNLDKRVKICIL